MLAVTQPSTSLCPFSPSPFLLCPAALPAQTPHASTTGCGCEDCGAVARCTLRDGTAQCVCPGDLPFIAATKTCQGQHSKPSAAPPSCATQGCPSNFTCDVNVTPPTCVCIDGLQLQNNQCVGESASLKLPSHPLPSHPLPSHPLPSHPLPSHPLPSHPLPSHPLPSNQLASQPLASRTFFSPSSISPSSVSLASFSPASFSPASFSPSSLPLSSLPLLSVFLIPVLLLAHFLLKLLRLAFLLTT
ncbi:unnamed protein product [Closterium sp. Naga37s-1]|nr:unnamed protein product [Closterium sp. Naga37s-1]